MYLSPLTRRDEGGTRSLGTAAIDVVRRIKAGSESDRHEDY
jgi:hypothetical protein